MKTLLALTTLLLTLNASANAAQVNSYKISITRGGTTETRVAYSFWSGEYPGPVIDVDAKRKGTTVVQGYKSLRNSSGKAKCAVKNGVYHPWSETETSAITYYSIVPLEEYIAEKDVTIETDDKQYLVKAGTVLTEFTYYSEGWVGFIAQEGSKRTQLAAFDPTFDDVDGFKRLTPKMTESKRASTEQWIYMRCDDGQKLFVSAKELLKTKNVQQGSVQGYGKVGPAREGAHF